jgi:large subunit ribosomal protein L15
MKLHDLRPNPGAHTAKTRVGRGIAAGKGKTAGRGTKGQKARAGGSIPPWFEGGQTPLHIRIPKLRGFRNRGKIVYEVVNLGAINRLVELGELAPGDLPGTASRSGRSAPITVNQEILRAAGLVSTLSRPLKVLGQGDVSAPLFVVADAFSKSAIEKIQSAGGTAQVLETPASPMAALLGTTTDEAPEAATSPGLAARTAEVTEPDAGAEPTEALAQSPRDTAADATATDDADATPRAPRRSRSKGASTEADGGAA